MRVTAITVFLFSLSVCELAFGQQEKLPWKEYTYPADGFALTVPTAPEFLNSVSNPDTTAYIVQLEADTRVVLRVETTNGCNAAIALMKERFSNDTAIVQSSLKDRPIDGHPGVEYKRKPNAQGSFERWYCVDKRLFVFSVTWPGSQAFPVAATRILGSFRLLAPNTQP
jgi:hypothetical protein